MTPTFDYVMFIKRDGSLPDGVSDSYYVRDKAYPVIHTGERWVGPRDVLILEVEQSKIVEARVIKGMACISPPSTEPLTITFSLD